MRALTYAGYGAPSDVLRWSEVPEPKIGPDTVLVQVRAAGVNPVDWQTIEGHLQDRFDTTFPVTPGWDLAGTVLQVGPNVTRFVTGDEVFGYARTDVIHHGSYAERIAVPERVLALKPKTLTWATAAATPISALTAHQALLDVLDIRAGETLLVQAAASSVGRFATQIARAHGVAVIGTASPRHHAELESRGVMPVDSRADVPAVVRAMVPGGVDAVLDVFGGPGTAINASTLGANAVGRIVSLSDDGVRSLGGRSLFARPDASRLDALAAMLDAGEIEGLAVSTSCWDEAGGLLEAGANSTLRGKHALLVS